ncbi:MAG: HAMP domain-containing histidine kinase, partial [Flavobacteriales bacterium]|nr:HAMP domain-containing histidine kinase [Flavobacteriales bacterium]
RYLPLSRQIFFSMSLMMIVCLGVFSIITSYHSRKSYIEQKEANLQHDVNILSREINYALRESGVLTSGCMENEPHLQEMLDVISSSHAVGIDLYTTSGSHIYKSATDYTAVYHGSASHSRGSSLPVSLVEKIDSTTSSIVIPEHTSSALIESIYSRLYNNVGDFIAISRITYPDAYTSSSDSYNLSSRMTTTLVILLTVALIISLVISQNITRPLREITRAITSTSSSGGSSPISRDVPIELRKIVNAYNAMLPRIESESQVLAQEEKERAWREMARIVAHEINNPLTPMRLAVQHHQMTFDASSPDATSKTSRLCDILLSQIDTLSQIATSFAEFSSSQREARSGRCDLRSVIRNVVGLYTGKNISSTLPECPVIVPIEATSIVQILSNMIKNAIEATRGDIPLTIDISLFIEDTHAVISIKDNGSGIPDDVLKNIFSPNFTTKNSGRGMGLSITEKIVKNAGGDIICNSQVGKGTEFVIKLPLISQ